MIAVLGAGIMGCCLALELSRRGRRVELVDRASQPVTGASLHNEGKLHLGYVYANDPQRRTHELVARGSLTFAGILERLTGRDASAHRESRPFQYFVPRDSQLPLSAVLEHFEGVDAAIEAIVREGGAYLGRRPPRHVPNSADEHRRLFSERGTLGSISTGELAVCTTSVAVTLRAAVAADPRISFAGDTVVAAAIRLPDGDVEVETIRAGRTASRRYAALANCLWDDRLRVDATAGICEDRPWLFRYKAGIHFTAGAAAREIPSATGVIGPYGDVVSQGDGTVYLSWYPTCRRGQTAGLDGRALHEQLHRNPLLRGLRRGVASRPRLAALLAAAGHRGLVSRSLRAMEAYVPALAGLRGHARRGKVLGGVIYALGSTDIDDATSTLHQRSAIGPAAHGSYVTVDTGKYCTAPMFAIEAADQLEQAL